MGENVVFHLNLPFPLGFPTAPVFRLGSEETACIERLACAARAAFALEDRYPLETMHAIVRIYSAKDGSKIGWHKDKRCFEECVAGVVMENSLPRREGLRFRPDEAHLGDEVGLVERSGDGFMFEGEARHGWEHGFSMPQDIEGEHRRVTLTMRWYRTNDPATASKLAKWRREGQHGKICVQFLGPERSGSDVREREGTGGADYASSALRVSMPPEPPKHVVPEEWSLKKLCNLAATKLRRPTSTAGVPWAVQGFECHEGASTGGAPVRVLDELAWRQLCANHIALREMRPVLRLQVVLEEIAPWVAQVD